MTWRSWSAKADWGAKPLSDYAKLSPQTEARIVVLDLSEVYVLGGGGLGMLVYLQQWTRDHGIQFKLFNPSTSVRERLEHASSMSAFDIATLHEMMALLGRADPRYALAA